MATTETKITGALRQVAETPLTDSQWRILHYLNWKMQCAADQEELGVGLDYDKAVGHLKELEALEADKLSELAKVMPQVPVYADRARPKVTHKKDGTPSENWNKWVAFLREHKLPITTEGPVRYVKGYKEPNPSSHTQVKDWLFGLGWDPITFKYEKDDNGNERKIPQVRNDNKELCESVLELADREPGIRVLEGLSIIQHRLGVFKGFVECAERVNCRVCLGDGHLMGGPDTYGKDCEDCGGKGHYWILRAGVGGLTNTLRFKHRKPLVNLPKVGVPWGEEIRSCLIATPGNTLVGSDLCSLESLTKRHYMFPHDPDYVQEMSVPGFDEHLDLAVYAGALTRDDYDYYISTDDQKTDRYKAIKAKRGPWKQTNYSGVYGVGAKKLARALKCSVSEAALLLENYWKRNWSVRQVAKEQFIKEISNGELWLKNPVSGFYINLRYAKDTFSSLNQSTGVYCFDNWLAFCKNAGVKVVGQFHDELIALTDNPEEVGKILKDAMVKTNHKIKLNVPLDCDVQTGVNYAKIH